MWEASPACPDHFGDGDLILRSRRSAARGKQERAGNAANSHTDKDGLRRKWVIVRHGASAVDGSYCNASTLAADTESQDC